MDAENLKIYHHYGESNQTSKTTATAGLLRRLKISERNIVIFCVRVTESSTSSTKRRRKNEQKRTI